jgi:hypothetical protein
MAVDKGKRPIMARIFAQLISGVISDREYEHQKSKLFTWRGPRDGDIDEAIEEACIWGELLCASYNVVRYSGDNALPPEFRQRLEELVDVLESDAEYKRGDPFKEVAYYNMLCPPIEKPTQPPRPLPDFFVVGNWISGVFSQIWKVFLRNK